MTSNLQKRALATGMAFVAIVIASLALQRYDRAPPPPAAPRTVGADWQQRGLLSETDYLRLRGIGRSVTQTRAISTENLDWLLARMQQSPSSIVHARVLGILIALASPPTAQKEKIKTAIAPLLQSNDMLDKRYAFRVQNRLALYRL